MTAQLWRVAANAPLRNPLTYSDETLNLEVKIGQRVSIPLGRRKTTGIVLGKADKTEASQPDTKTFEIKSILGIESTYPELPPTYIRWMQWISEYYLYPIGLVFETAFPPLERAEKHRKSSRPPVVAELKADSPPLLTEDQERVIKSIRSNRNFKAHLVHGVTGSGKTEVYLHLLERVLAEKKQGLVLVPEISLTPQLVQRFARRFGNQIAVIHSHLTEREKTNQWWEIVEGKKQILIGARSALFCPIPNLGLIIVDEEHEPSFKQEEKLKYHARDCAVVLAQMNNCPIVLGSATPSLESWHNATIGKYTLHTMASRVGARALPEVQVINMRLEKETPKDNKLAVDLPSWLHPDLYAAIQETLAAKEQVALFLNRRGVAGLLTCPQCGYSSECPNCDISLTLHGRNHLTCHYCNYHESAKEFCPSCKEGQPKPLGVGTEQIEKDISLLFPEAKVGRADRDEVQTREDMEDLIEKMESGSTDILIGTQMIAKGLDFPKLTLVGLIMADIGFNLPDFRATERSFQLLTQMSGRSGRHIPIGGKPGQVYIQTLNPEFPALQYSLQADYEGFAKSELEIRKALNYPPFGKLASFRIQGTQLGRVQQTARMAANRAQALLQKHEVYREVQVLGPAEAAIAKLRGKFRYHLLVKAASTKSLQAYCSQLLGDESWVTTGVRIAVDIDPLNLI